MSPEQSSGARPAPYDNIDELPLRYRPTKFFINVRNASEGSPNGLLAAYQNGSGEPQTCLAYLKKGDAGSSVVAIWKVEQAEGGIVVDTRRVTMLNLASEDSLVKIERRDSGRDVLSESGDKLLLSQEFNPEVLIAMSSNPMAFSHNSMTDLQFSQEFEGIRMSELMSINEKFTIPRQLAVGETSVV